MLTLLNTQVMHRIRKDMLYAYLYNGYKMLQQQIDEEGCGAVFGEYRAILHKEVGDSPL